MELNIRVELVLEREIQKDLYLQLNYFSLDNSATSEARPLLFEDILPTLVIYQRTIVCTLINTSSILTNYAKVQQYDMFRLCAEKCPKPTSV